ncbi:MAG: D-alanyl-D-alanine carboxypeptidase family protein, partial [Acetivibrio ethanolgignens]
MKRYWRKRIFCILCIFLTFLPGFGVGAEETAITISAQSAVLMEGSTGKILYEMDKDKQLIPASITKIMTLLLIFEALDTGKLTLEEEVSVSEYAASMGGSQVYLEPFEKQTVNTMIKCISIASANDASVAMAEHISGSESEFVARMNERAKELGMKNTHFLNCCGLDDTITEGHYSSAYDIALMSRELITKHPQISNYSTVWMDSFTHTTKKGSSEFGLTNTNKLVRTYNGITGLKTGSTSKAKYCLSATAKRNGMDLIAVVMASESPKERFVDAAKLLDYGFASCSLYTDENEELLNVRLPVLRGKKDEVGIMAETDFSQVLLRDESENDITKKIVDDENL